MNFITKLRKISAFKQKSNTFLYSQPKVQGNSKHLAIIEFSGSFNVDTVRIIAKKFNLDISLFEKYGWNGMLSIFLLGMQFV